MFQENCRAFPSKIEFHNFVSLVGKTKTNSFPHTLKTLELYINLLLSKPQHTQNKGNLEEETIKLEVLRERENQVDFT